MVTNYHPFIHSILLGLASLCSQPLQKRFSQSPVHSLLPHPLVYASDDGPLYLIIPCDFWTFANPKLCHHIFITREQEDKNMRATNRRHDTIKSSSLPLSYRRSRVAAGKPCPFTLEPNKICTSKRASARFICSYTLERCAI